MKQLSFFRIAAACVIALACGTVAKAQKAVPGELIDASAFETEIDGHKVGLYTISNGKISAQITNYGGYIVAINTPDKNGVYANVVGHNKSIKEYQGFGMNPTGASLGRYANRIGNARFTLDGKEYNITKNNGENTLHGGSKGFDHTVWDVVKHTKKSLVLKCVLEDGLDGFPGTLTTFLTFTVTKDNAVAISFESTTDKTTVCSLSHHVYFNLNGMDTDKDILNHVITLDSDSIVEVDAALIPTGRFLPVDSTPNDFRSGVLLSERQFAAPQPSFKPGERPTRGAGMQMAPVPEGMVRSYDLCYTLNHSKPGKVEKVASLYCPETGRYMEVLNNHPGLQLYTGNRRGVALESEMYPDSPNKPEFPSTTLRPGEKYKHTVVYKFSVK